MFGRQHVGNMMQYSGMMQYASGIGAFGGGPVAGGGSPPQSPGHLAARIAVAPAILHAAIPAATLAAMPAPVYQQAINTLVQGGGSAAITHALDSEAAAYASAMNGAQSAPASSGGGDSMAAPIHPQARQMAGNGPRRYIMGFGVTSLAAGGNTLVNGQPQVNFRPHRLTIPSPTAPAFVLNDFKIGQRSQFAANAAVPAVMFTETAVDSTLQLDTANIGQFVTLDVTNVSSNTANFSAGLVGLTLDS